MTCEEFVERWYDEAGFALARLPLFFHLLKCRECRERLSFMKRLFQALQEGEIAGDGEAFFLAMEERLLEEAKQVVPSLSLSSPSSPLSLPWGWGACIGGLLLAFCFLFLFIGHSNIKWRITFWDILPPGGEAEILSQLDRKDMVELNRAMALSLPHGEPFSTITPWADALESAGSLSPAELDALLKGTSKQGRETINQIGGVA